MSKGRDGVNVSSMRHENGAVLDGSGTAWEERLPQTAWGPPLTGPISAELEMGLMNHQLPVNGPLMYCNAWLPSLWITAYDATVA